MHMFRDYACVRIMCSWMMCVFLDYMFLGWCVSGCWIVLDDVFLDDVFLDEMLLVDVCSWMMRVLDYVCIGELFLDDVLSDWMFLDDVFLDEKASLCLARVHILSNLFLTRTMCFLWKNTSVSSTGSHTTQSLFLTIATTKTQHATAAPSSTLPYRCTRRIRFSKLLNDSISTLPLPFCKQLSRPP